MTDIKRQPLPWFAFNVAGYLKDTLRLTTESHGAYLLLMLDYYATCEPCPDDDDILAAVAKLPIEVWKAKHRKVIEPFFKIRDGKWIHDRIEREQLEAERKLTSSRDRAVAGGRARAAQFRAESEKRAKTPGKDPDPAAASARAEPQAQPQGQPQGQPEVTPKVPHLHSTDIRKEASLSTPPALALMRPLPSDYRLSEDVIAQCHADGATEEDLANEFDKFNFHHREAGSLSADWDATWGRWWFRWKEHHAKLAAKPKAPPRIEVNRKPKIPTPDSWKPNAAHAALCVEHGYSLDQMEELFRDVGKSNGYRYIDHDAAFRNFIKNQQNFKRGSSHGARQNSPPGRGSIVHALDGAITHLEREIAADNEMRAGAVVGLPDE